MSATMTQSRTSVNRTFRHRRTGEVRVLRYTRRAEQWHEVIVRVEGRMPFAYRLRSVAEARVIWVREQGKLVAAGFVIE